MDKALSVLLFFALGVYWGLGIGEVNFFSWPIICVSTILTYIFFNEFLEIYGKSEEVYYAADLVATEDNDFYFGKLKSLDGVKDKKLAQFLGQENPQLAAVVLSALPESRRTKVFSAIDTSKKDGIKEQWDLVKVADTKWIDYLDEAIGQQSHKIS